MPISDCEVRDPRIRRTRQLLQKALGNLLQTKGLDEISVQDITDAATVNRATFYDHYTDKFALFEAMVAGGFHALLQERNVRFDGTCPSAILAIVLAVCDYLSETHTGGDGCARHSAFQPLMDAAITASIRRVLRQGIGKCDGNVGAPALSLELIANAASWAIYGAVKAWFDAPGHPPAELIGPAISDLILPMLETVRPVADASGSLSSSGPGG
ncbi:MAG: TetR/AcrR family transcriptional regulator [Bryobacteraceae bacterium]